MEDIKEKLLNKSEEAFIMAVEIYNKPTIKYRVEGFAFFICNAWELMLKARLIDTQGPESIYYKNKPGRTISLEQCIKLIFTNNKDPLRINLERIIDLRNTSTHFITEEYEQIYVPLFQSCVFNYNDKLFDFFSRKITDRISTNFLTLNIKPSDIQENAIRARYPKQIADRFLKANRKIQTSAPETGNGKYAIIIRHEYYLTKKPKEASLPISITKNPAQAVCIIKDPKDMQNLCPNKTKTCVNKINTLINRENIPFINPKARKPEDKNRFNAFHFQLFLKFYDIKSNPRYCYAYRINQQTLYSYSQATIDLIWEEIKKDPEHIIQNLYNKNKQNK